MKYAQNFKLSCVQELQKKSTDHCTSDARKYRKMLIKVE